MSRVTRAAVLLSMSSLLAGCFQSTSTVYSATQGDKLASLPAQMRCKTTDSASTSSTSTLIELPQGNSTYQYVVYFASGSPGNYALHHVTGNTYIAVSPLEATSGEFIFIVKIDKTTLTIYTMNSQKDLLQKHAQDNNVSINYSDGFWNVTGDVVNQRAFLEALANDPQALSTPSMNCTAL